MSTLQDSDLFIVDRNGTNYQLPNSQMSTLQDTDLFVVERSGVNYKVEAKDVNTGSTGSIETPVAVLTPLNGAGTNEGEPYQPLSTAITAVGADGEVVYETDTIASVVTGGTLTTISCFQDTDSGSSAVAAIYVDGVILTNSGVGSVTEGAFSSDGSNTTIAPMFDGNTSTSCFSRTGGFATFTFSPPIAFDTLEVRGWTSNAFSPVYVNGEAVPGMLQQSNGGLSTVSVGNTLLTFPTDNNFDKFEVGDVVQTASWYSGGVGDVDGAINNRNNWSDGNLASSTTASYITGNELAGVQITFDPPLRDLTSLRTATGIASSNAFAPRFSINYSGTGSPAFFTIGSWQWQGGALPWKSWPSNDFVGKEISTIEFWNAQNNDPSYIQNVGAIEVNGTVVTGGGATYAITVINPPGPTITTDGGTWTTSDTLSKTVSSDATLTFNSDLELANMVGPLSQVDENGDVKIPVTNTIASVDTSSFAGSGNPPDGSNAGSWSNVFDGTSCNSSSCGIDTKTETTWTFDTAVSIGAGDTFEVYSSGASNYSNVFGWSYEATPDSFTMVSGGAGIHSSGWGWDTLSIIGDLKCLRIGSSPGFGVTGFRLNGVELSAGLVLTFNSPNPDLQYFQPGDNVGTSSGFAAVAYTGNSGTQEIKTGFSPGLVWIKVRDEQFSHSLFDAIRGPEKRLKSNDPDSEATDVNSVTSFDNNGFTLGNYDSVNKTGYNFAAWCWETSDTTVTNNDGEQTSQVRSNGNFSVVKYSSTGGPTNVGHGLGNVPAFYIIKRITNSSDWTVYHQSLGSGTALLLNSSNQADENAVYWNNTDPTDTTFNLGSAGGVSGPGNDYIAYCWAETPGVSSFGEYTGDLVQGVAVECGFKPAFLLVKSSASNESWFIFDSARSPTNPVNSYLLANTSTAEGANDSTTDIDFTDTGFTVIGSSSGINGSGNNYIYAAFAGSNPIEVIDVDVDNNTMTVDGGDWYGTNDWNQSQEWSSSSTGTWPKAVVNMFDGDFSTYSYSNASGGEVNLTGLTALSSIRVYGSTLNADSWQVTLSGSVVNIPLTTGSDYGWTTVPTSFPVTVDKFRNNDGAGRVYAVEVDGKLLVDSSVTPTGETVVTGPPLIASANDVEYLDGNTLGVNGVSGTWFPGLHAQGAEVTSTAPSPESIQYTSANGTPLTTPFTGTDATLTTRTWTWQVSNAATGPWSDLTTRIDSPGQDGAVPLADRPTLEPNKFYQVKVRYDSNNAEYVESTFNTFKTGDN